MVIYTVYEFEEIAGGSAIGFHLIASYTDERKAEEKVKELYDNNFYGLTYDYEATVMTTEEE